jgi:hypothetical protein
MEVEHLRASMRLSPGQRIAQAITLSDAYLQGRASAEREELPALAARSRALRDGGRRT